MNSNDYKLSQFVFSIQLHILTTLRKNAFQNVVGKEKNAGNQYFLQFQTLKLSTPLTAVWLNKHKFVWSSQLA